MKIGNTKLKLPLGRERIGVNCEELETSPVSVMSP